MNINKIDLAWNYAATFMKIASSALLLPLILTKMPSEMVGIWSIFITITALTGLLDFGFGPSFTRNISYIFGGVSKLQVDGVEENQNKSSSIDYILLKSTISAMKWFYLRISILVFVFLSSLGTLYIYAVLESYGGDKTSVYLAWGILCLITTYNMFTLYYDSLLIGKGLIKKAKQITIIGQSVYLLFAAILIVLGYGLIAIVSSQVLSVLIIRWLSYRSFYSKALKTKLDKIITCNKKEVLKIITPNAVKIGLTTLGGVLSQRSTIIIGSLYLTLEEIASFSITIQLIAIIATMARIYISTHQPKIAQLRVSNNILKIKALYLKGVFQFFIMFIFGGLFLILLGNYTLNLIDSKTILLSTSLTLAALIIYLLENNYNIAIMILLSNNKVPFFRASLLSGVATVLLLLIMFNFTTYGLWSLIIAPGIAALYNDWKWPFELIKQLKIKKEDLINIITKWKTELI